MRRVRRRFIHLLIFVGLIAAVSVLFWLVFRIEPAGRKDYGRRTDIVHVA